MNFRARAALLSAVPSLLSVCYLACSGDDVPSTPKTDAGLDSAADVAQQDSSTQPDASDAAAPTVRTAVVSNLVTVRSATRFCVAAAASGEPGIADMIDAPPFPAAPGLGAGGVASSALPTAVIGKQVRIFAYYTSSLDAFALSKKSCKELSALTLLVSADAGAGDGGIKTDGGVALIQRLDFDVSSTIDGKLFDTTSKFILLATGCPKSSDPSLASPYCNPPDNVGDFDVYAFKTDGVSPAPGKTRLQPLFEVTAADYFNIPAQWNMGVHYADAGDAGFVRLPVPDGGLGVYRQSGPLTLAADVPSIANAASLYDENEGAQQVDEYPMSEVLVRSGLSPQTKLDDAFTFIAMGNPFDDPKLPDGGLNPRAIGALLIPSK